MDDKVTTLHPTFFSQEEEIPGIALPPGRGLLAGFPGKGVSEGVWRKFAGKEDLPAIYSCGSCASAFDVASYLSGKKILQDWDSVLVTSQHAGIGQYGRKWLSPEGNLYLVWKFPSRFTENGRQTGLLPLFLGASMAEALLDLGVSIRIKWPNDLVLDDKKIGGMLIRSSQDLVLAGIGINLAFAPDPSLLREGASLEAGTLAGKGLPDSPLAFWMKLLPQVFLTMKKIFFMKTFSELPQILEKRLWRKGKEILVYLGKGEKFSAILFGIGEDGGLRLLTEEGEKVLYSGSIGPA